MTYFHLKWIGICVLAYHSSGQLLPSEGAKDSSHSHKHTDSDLDFVQCQHSFYRINKNNGRPELVTGQESRVDPSRQYLPLPAPQQPNGPERGGEAPAASFNDPNYLSVESTFLSPNLQTNYKSLFGENNRADFNTPEAAQNVPTNALSPATSRKINNKKHSDEDDEDNLERLCNDAFHSFLCKPIKGPRKTPTGRLRPNAILPPEVLARLASSQDASTIGIDNQVPESAPNNIDYSVFKPTTKLPSQQTPSKQYLPFQSRLSTTQNVPTSTFPISSPAPFTNILKDDLPAPVFPSPSNTNSQIIKPQPENAFRFKTSTFRPATFTFPVIQYTNDKINDPYPKANVPRYDQIQLFRPSPQPHDCKKHNLPLPSEVANPSNDSPAFLRKFQPTTTTTQKPFTYAPLPSSSFPKFNSFPKVSPSIPIPAHDCSKHQYPFSSASRFQNQYFPKQNNQPPSKPTVQSIVESQRIPFSSNNVAQIIAQPQQIKSITVPPQTPSGYTYNKPAIPFPSPEGNPSFQDNRFTSIPTTAKPTNGYVYDQPKIPFPSNNVARIIPQPAQQKLSTSPTTSKPKTPCKYHQTLFPSQAVEGNPTNQNDVVVRPLSTSNAYVYDKPNIPFPPVPERGGSSNQNPVSIRPYVTSTERPSTGYNYDKPENPLLLPNPSNNFQNIVANPANNGYNYLKPEKSLPNPDNLPSNNIFAKQFTTPRPTPSIFATTSKPYNGYSYDKPRIPFPTNINSKVALPSDDNLSIVAKPQNQIDVAVQPGYFYNKPESPVESPQPSNEDPGVEGYFYNKPNVPFIR